jgi:hypothetical protein
MSTMPDHRRPITVEIPVIWTAEQALAVWEMLDQLREKIWAHYSDQLQDLLAEQRSYQSWTAPTWVLLTSTSDRLIVHQRLNQDGHPAVPTYARPRGLTQQRSKMGP